MQTKNDEIQGKLVERGANMGDYGCHVGQDEILRGGCQPPPFWCPPGLGPIANRPQLTKLPHNQPGLNRGIIVILRAALHLTP